MRSWMCLNATFQLFQVYIICLQLITGKMFEFNREVIKDINRVRNQPVNTGKAIFQTFSDSYHGSQLHAFGKVIDTFQGIEALEDLQKYLSLQEPTHSLMHSKSLDMVAQEIATQKGREGKTQNQKPRVIYDKLQQYASPNGKVGELISLCASTPNQVSSYFLMDDGLASRKRRRMVLDPIYKYVGVGHAPHSQHQTITVIVLAQIIQSEKDTYFLENTRLSQKINLPQQQEASFRRSSQNVRESEFY